MGGAQVVVRQRWKEMMQGVVTQSQRAEQFSEDRIPCHVVRVELIDVAPRLAVGPVAMRSGAQMVRQDEDGQSVECGIRVSGSSPSRRKEDGMAP
jgi:hypothetical protein